MILVLLTSVVSSARDVLTEHYQVAHLDLSAGLPHNNVNQFFVDSQGFVWISTYGGGAVRYDGFSFTTTGLASPQGWTSNSCKSITEDKFHRLWIAYDERTDVIDMRTMSRTTPQFGTTDIGRILDRPSVAVYNDTKGAIWHVTGDTIFRYTFDEKGVVSHISRYHYIGNTPDVRIKDIEQNGSVWACVDGGLYRLSERNGQLVREDIAAVMNLLHDFFVTDMLKRGSKVWISTNQGLYAYDHYTQSLQAYHHSNEDSSSISHDFTTSLAEAPDGRLLVGSLRGINILSEQQNAFEHWDYSTMDHPLPSDFVHCLMVRDGQIWIGTETSGIVKLSPRPLVFRNYTHDGRAAALSPRPVNAMYVEPNGALWVGTVEGGLNRKSVDSQDFEHWTTQNSALSHNSVSVLEADAHGQLWIGTWGGGLNRISLKDKRLQHIEMPAGMVTQTNYIGALAYDKYNDALWIGSNDGIFYYDLKTGVLEDPFENNRQVRGCIGALIDKNAQLWIGCITGVRVIDLRSRANGGGMFRVRTLFTKLDHPESNILDRLCCFCETKDGTLWLGSNGYGLYRRIIDEKTGKETFEVLTTDDGLANNTVRGIVEDSKGRLWITTINGLSVYDPLTHSFINYSEKDGLLCQCFYWNSAVKAPDGTLCLGSMRGLIEVAGENKEAIFPIHLTFTRLLVDNQIVTATNSDIVDADISQAKTIRLHESNKSFTIEFSALTYAGETTGHYSYRLKGFENEWTHLKPGEHAVRYTSLTPGKYTFEVRYSLGESDNDDHKIAVRIEVVPYFWKSWWFTFLLFVVLLGVIVWFYRYKEKEWKRQEAEKLLTPIRKVLVDAAEPQQLQTRIQNILDNHEKLEASFHKSVEADKEEVLRHSKSFMDHAMEIIEKNYQNSDFGITEFAEFMGMSKSLISKRMNIEAGQSTGQFIRNYRLNVARKLLLENVGNRNITEIAYKVGFNDPKYFTRCFTRQYGCSPSTYTGDEESTDT